MDFENNDQFEEQVMPDAGIIKKSDDTFCVIKFVIEDNDLVVYSTELSKEDLSDIPAIDELDEYSILFVKIKYEFEFDEASGILEMQLSRLVTLSDANGELVTAEQVIENAPEDLIPVYLDVIKSL